MTILLYALLGVLLSAAGVDVLDKPWEFFGILGLVLVIEYTGRNA